MNYEAKIQVEITNGSNFTSKGKQVSITNIMVSKHSIV